MTKEISLALSFLVINWPKMSYQRPQDPYMHSNASEYDQRYQQGSYQDEPQNAADYYSSNQYRSDSPAHMQKGSEMGSNYGDHQYVDFSQQGSYNQQAYGAGGAGAAGYGAGQGAAYKDYSSSAHNLTGGAPGKYISLDFFHIQSQMKHMLASRGR